MPNSASFPKTAHLKKPIEFKQVFLAQQRLTNHYFRLYYLVNQSHTARLGIVVSKRTARLAVRRNQIKRLIRELFRVNQSWLGGYDLVVLAQPATLNATNSDLIKCLHCLLENLPQASSKLL